MQRQLNQLRTLAFNQAIDYFIQIAKFKGASGEVIVKLLDWQVEEIRKIVSTMDGEYLWRWQRGFSKTILLAILGTFLACYNLRTCIVLPTKKQLAQLRLYLESCELFDKRGRSTKRAADDWYYLAGKPMMHLDIANFSTVNSGRFDCLLWDECAQLIYEPKKEELIYKMDGVFRSMKYKVKLYSSTPITGSEFEKIERFLPKDRVSHRNYLNTPENFIIQNQFQLEILEKEREAYIARGREWQWIQENLAEYQSAGGTVFTTAVYGPHTHTQVTRWGFDFHDYTTGHMGVGMTVDRQDKAVYIISEKNFRYQESSTTDESLKFMTLPLFHGCWIYGEPMGYNAGFYKQARKYGLRNVASEQLSTSKGDATVANLFDWKIYIDPDLTPETYNDFRTAQWKDAGKYRIQKEHSGTIFRNHYLDCVKNAVPRLQTGYAIRSRRDRFDLDAQFFV